MPLPPVTEDQRRISLEDALREIPQFDDIDIDSGSGSGSGDEGTNSNRTHSDQQRDFEKERAAFIRGLHAHSTKSFETNDVPSRPHTPRAATEADESFQVLRCVGPGASTGIRRTPVYMSFVFQGTYTFVLLPLDVVFCPAVPWLRRVMSLFKYY